MKKSVLMFLFILLVIGMGGWFTPANAQLPPNVIPLSQVPVPKDPQEAFFIQDEIFLQELGKALFFDMQLGSDSTQGCFSCHFHAGADNRTKGSLHPGQTGIFGFNPVSGNIDFPHFNPTVDLQPTDFPLHRLLDPGNRLSGVLFSTDSRVSSPGTIAKQFLGFSRAPTKDRGSLIPDPIFQINGINLRQVQGRNTPTAINAAFNHRNFWDGRAHNIFNGVNPFGPMDEKAGIYVVGGNGKLLKVKVRLNNSSLASQAVGPPLSKTEMSWDGRNWPEIGKRMIFAIPLRKQRVHPNDSLLGKYSRMYFDAGGQLKGSPGLKIANYELMIKKAFQPFLWTSSLPVIIQGEKYRQIEANFSFFFGLAIQAYERTLISDQTKFDQYLAGQITFTPEEELGKNLFFGKADCFGCHGGPEFSNAALSNINAAPNNGNPVEFMLSQSGMSNYDNGFYNIGIRLTAEDIGRGGSDPFGYPLSHTRLAFLKNKVNPPPGISATVPPFKADMLKYIPNLPCAPGEPCRDPNPLNVVVDGTFKVPQLRNIELTGPYMHNGSEGSLLQVVEFYDRGGNFDNFPNLHPDMRPLNLTPQEVQAIVSFLLTLTDERVKFEKAPFDRPEIHVPIGFTSQADCTPTTPLGFSICEEILSLPAVGMDGSASPLGTFLNIDPFQPQP